MASYLSENGLYMINLNRESHSMFSVVSQEKAHGRGGKNVLQEELKTFKDVILVL